MFVNDSSKGPSLAGQSKPFGRSTSGCVTCKKRKVKVRLPPCHSAIPYDRSIPELTLQKCDERVPECRNCMKSSIPCYYARGTRGREHNPTSHEKSAFTFVNVSTERRGRGRPRKDLHLPSHHTPEAHSTTSQGPSTALDARVLNADDMELLMHFMLHTSKTIVESGREDDPVVQSWARNVPKVGFTFHFVLHLVLGVAGYHLVHLTPAESTEKPKWGVLAKHHAEKGLALLTATLSELDNNNAGALYVGSILSAYCIYAAGPTDANDLLVCNVNDGVPQASLALVRGVRMIRRDVNTSDLFSGLLEPLGREHDARFATAPVIGREDQAWLNSTKPLGHLRMLLESYSGVEASVYMTAFSTVERIYRATFGDEHGFYYGPWSYRMVFIWLHQMEDDFVLCLREKKPHALLILAYYAVLLKRMKHIWSLAGWAEHILSRIAELLEDDFIEWFMWPRDMVLG